VLRVVDPDEIPDAPLKQKKITRADLREAAVAALAGFMFAELLRVAMHMRSTLGFAIWWYVAFMVVYFLLVRDRHDPEAALDRVVTVAVWSIGLLAAGALIWMVGYVVVKGLPKLTGSFFTQDMSHVGPLTPGGGVKHAIIGTLEQVGLAIIIVVPLGILTAVYLHEINGRLARPVRFIVDAMSGLPSIVAGLLLFTVWVQSHGYSGAAGAAALAVLMLPTMTRASEEILRTVPDTLREGALALGAPQYRLVQRVVLPTALSGLVTAALLSIARAIGETAPLLFTAFGADAVNNNPFKGAQSDLPLFIWARIRQPNQTQIDRAWTGALVLVAFVFVMFVAARIVANRGQRKLQGSRR
jgi:phosphate transport system permease protein